MFNKIPQIYIYIGKKQNKQRLKGRIKNKIKNPNSIHMVLSGSGCGFGQKWRHHPEVKRGLADVDVFPNNSSEAAELRFHPSQLYSQIFTDSIFSGGLH